MAGMLALDHVSIYVCFAPTVSAMTAPRAPKRFLRADRRIARGLMFNLGIEFGTEQHDDGRYPQPNHETNDRAQRDNPDNGRVFIRAP